MMATKNKFLNSNPDDCSKRKCDQSPASNNIQPRPRRHLSCTPPLQKHKLEDARTKGHHLDLDMSVAGARTFMCSSQGARGYYLEGSMA